MSRSAGLSFVKSGRRGCDGHHKKGVMSPIGTKLQMESNKRTAAAGAKPDVGPADLVERIRRLVHSKPPVLSGMEAAS
jgi:hypothetical protein